MAKDHCCNTVASWTPVLLLVGLIAYSYYAYVIQLCIFTISNIPEKVTYLVLFHILLLLMLWSLYVVITAKPSPVPPQFFLTHSELKQYEEEIGRLRLIAEKSKTLPVHCRTATGEIRFCESCKCIKPDRAHHCSSCHRCILRMDHHCVWVNGCVCYDNYKLFVLLVTYSCLYCLLISVTSTQYFVNFCSKIGELEVTYGDIVYVSLFCIALVLSITLFAFLTFHCNLIRLNQTTVENSYNTPIFINGPDKSGFNHGTFANFVDVFGEQKLLWFLPVRSGNASDGVTYPRNLLSDSMSKYQSTDSSQVSLCSTPAIKTSLQLVQPVSRSPPDSDAAEDVFLKETGRRRSSSGEPTTLTVKQQKWMW